MIGGCADTQHPTLLGHLVDWVPRWQLEQLQPQPKQNRLTTFSRCLYYSASVGGLVGYVRPGVGVVDICPHLDTYPMATCISLHPRFVEHRSSAKRLIACAPPPTLQSVRVLGCSWELTYIHMRRPELRCANRVGARKRLENHAGSIQRAKKLL